MMCNQAYRYNFGKTCIIDTYFKIEGYEKGNIGFFPY